MRLSTSNSWTPPLLRILTSSGNCFPPHLSQDPFLETTEGTSITIKCSHPNIRTGDFVYFLRQRPGQAPELLGVSAKGSKELPAIDGRLWVSADRRWSALRLGGPRRGDAAVYYCALGPRAEEPGLRPGTNRRHVKGEGVWFSEVHIVSIFLSK
uniref:Immunoglobulin V-set domain-containing protein n=1 Tax=Taeniopygia guttata TaxID=59729 RepID=A0A674H3M1_TAEGU